MGKPLKVKGIEIGAGRPRIIVSILTRSERGVVERARRLANHPAVDIVELRVDGLAAAARSPAAAARCAERTVQALNGKPLLATWRSAGQGGAYSLTDAAYAELIGALLEGGRCDLVDIEFARLRSCPALLDRARLAGVPTIVSHHDLTGTPSLQKLLDLFEGMHQAGADIVKLVTTARSPGDALTLLNSTWQMRQRRPGQLIMSMAMGEAVRLSRIASTMVGSVASFAKVGRPSAPGQIEATTLRQILDEIA